MKLLIITAFTILSFSCFSQVRERVNGDTLLQDFWETENYGRERKSFEDSVKISVWRDYDETASCGSFCHIIENDSILYCLPPFCQRHINRNIANAKFSHIPNDNEPIRIYIHSSKKSFSFGSTMYFIST